MLSCGGSQSALVGRRSGRRPLRPRPDDHKRHPCIRRDALKSYIERQGADHKTEDFKSELLRTLRAHDVAFDETYVFD